MELVPILRKSKTVTIPCKTSFYEAAKTMVKQITPKHSTITIPDSELRVAIEGFPPTSPVPPLPEKCSEKRYVSAAQSQKLRVAKARRERIANKIEARRQYQQRR